LVGAKGGAFIRRSSHTTGRKKKVVPAYALVSERTAGQKYKVI